MKEQKKEIKPGVKLHGIQTNKFKTNLLSVFMTTPLTRENITKEAVISAVLRRGSMKMPTQEQISIELENMYGASFDCGIEKIGDYHVIKFYLESISDEFLPEKEEILQKGIHDLFEIVFNPLVINGGFKEEYIKSEKENIRQMIEGKIDNKAKYALDRCIEEMYPNKPYGLYKYGYVEDLEKINAKELYEYYQEMIKNCKIDIFVSGNVDINSLENIVRENEQIKQLEQRNFTIQEEEKKDAVDKPNIVTESMEITQGKLILGYDVLTKEEEEKYTVLLYNTILGSGANSKLFQNVREKASLAYTAGSNYIRQKNNIFVRAGIEIQNYEKALEIIKEQVKDMKDGKFTDQEIQDAKRTIIATIQFIPDEQDTQISYYFGQEFVGKEVSFDEYIEKINQITKEQIVEIASKVKLNTIYFLKD